jgi:hypothetical protein
MEELLLTLPGANALIERFGRWPSFHDAEVVSLSLNRTGASTLTIHIFRMKSEVDARGHYVCDLHTLVTFSFGEILGINLADFNHQNVISGLEIDRTGAGFEVMLHACYGLAGSIRTSSISIGFADGLPEGSVYSA